VTTEKSPTAPQPKRQIRTALAILTALLCLTIVFVALRDRTPDLTRRELEARWAQWRTLRVPSYTLALTVERDKSTAEHYEVRVRDNEVDSFSINGQRRPNNPSYSIDGLFDILDRELEITEGKDKQAGLALQNALLKAAFDEKYAFPQTFKRIAGKGLSCFIRVDKFAPLYSEKKVE
jgi:hypothetical protein